MCFLFTTLAPAHVAFHEGLAEMQRFLPRGVGARTIDPTLAFFVGTTPPGKTLSRRKQLSSTFFKCSSSLKNLKDVSKGKPFVRCEAFAGALTAAQVAS